MKKGRILALIAFSVWLCVVTLVLLRCEAPLPPAPRQSILFTYEQGDVIGTFAAKIAAALTLQGVPTLVAPNHEHPTHFWHTSYRPNAWRPAIAPNQSVYYNLENVRVNPLPGETVLQTRALDSDQVGREQRILYVPWAWVAFEERYSTPNANALLRGSDFDARAVLARKTRFCSFMASLCRYESYYLQLYGGGQVQPGAKLDRTTFYELLNTTYKPVDALGRCHHNVDMPPPPAWVQETGARWSGHDQSIYAMRPYKFALCMENVGSPGYFTEKLFNAYLAEAVPIYWGDPQVHTLVNTDAFVWCRPAEPWSRCLDEVRALDADDELYMRKLRTPLLKGNVIPPWMNYAVLARRLRKAWSLY